MSAVTMDKNNVMKWVITFVLGAIMLLLPGEVLTPEIKKFLALTIVCMAIVCFDLLDFCTVSVLLLAMYVVCGVAPAATVFSSFTQPVVWLYIGTFALTVGLEETGLLKRISLWCISRFGGTFNGTVYGLVLTGYILGIISFGNSWLIMATLTYGFLKSLNISPGSKEGAVMIIAGGIAATGANYFFYNPAGVALMTAGAQAVLPNYEILWPEYMKFSLLQPVFAFLFVFIMLKIAKTKNSSVSGGKDHFADEYKALGKMNSAEKKSGLILAFLFIYLMTSPFTKFNVNYAFMIAPWLYFIPEFKIADPSSVKKINFSMWFFVVACMSIGTVGVGIGVGELIGSSLGPILSNVGVTVSSVLILALATLANMLMTPTALMAIFSAPVTQLAIDMGINPNVFMFAVKFGGDLILLPHETPVTAFLFSFGYIKMKDYVKYKGLYIAIFFIIFVVLMIPSWYLFGLV